MSRILGQFEVAAYYDGAIQTYASLPEHSLKEILTEIQSIKSDSILVSLTERTSLNAAQEEKIIGLIRSIRPQARGSIVASGGKPLPISGSKKLNLQNTPVLILNEIISHEKKPRYVFPCRVGEKYYSVLEGISFLRQRLAQAYSPNLGELPGQMEEELAIRLRQEPYALETGLTLVSSESFTPTGKTDLIFSDSKSKYLVIEVERKATDSAVGQILRLTAGFEKGHGLSQGVVRCGIVCLRIHDNVLEAARRAGIEVWRYTEEVPAFKKL